ncbi:MAG: SRPBCC domain-containing protein [Actinomycetota bacterium]|nr:SRPBCC domain-containing protein [Actinomycetota bacterium]
MGESDFTVSFVVDQPPEAIFEAINDVRGWWSGNVEGETNALGDTFSYRYEDVHFSKQTITEFEPGRRVVWHVEDASLSFTTEPDEWVGSDIMFEILPRDAAYELRFTHVGLTPKLECYAGCSGAWTFYVGESLRDLITSGAGKPNPRE